MNGADCHCSPFFHSGHVYLSLENAHKKKLNVNFYYSTEA